jgi:hypothetical protein
VFFLLLVVVVLWFFGDPFRSIAIVVVCAVVVWRLFRFAVYFLKFIVLVGFVVGGHIFSVQEGV